MLLNVHSQFIVRTSMCALNILFSKVQRAYRPLIFIVHHIMHYSVI